MARTFGNLSKNELNSGIETHIINSFLEIVFKEGMGTATLMNVAKKSRVSFGTVRNYFAPPKASMEEAAMFTIMTAANLYAEHFINSLRINKPFHPIHSYIEMNYQWWKLKPHHASYLIFYYYRSSTSLLPKPTAEFYLQAAWIRIESLLNESVGLGLYKRPKDTLKLAKEVHSMLLGKWITDCILNHTKPKDIKAVCFRVDQVINSCND